MAKPKRVSSARERIRTIYGVKLLADAHNRWSLGRADRDFQLRILELSWGPGLKNIPDEERENMMKLGIDGYITGTSLPRKF